MRQICSVIISLFLLTCIPAFSAAPQASDQQSKPTTVQGTVKSFDPGKAIEIDAEGTPHNFDLTAQDTVFNISPQIKVGSQVKITEMMDPATGRKSVTIAPVKSS